MSELSGSCNGPFYQFRQAEQHNPIVDPLIAQLWEIESLIMRQGTQLIPDLRTPLLPQDVEYETTCPDGELWSVPVDESAENPLEELNDKPFCLWDGGCHNFGFAASTIPETQAESSGLPLRTFVLSETVAIRRSIRTLPPLYQRQLVPSLKRASSWANTAPTDLLNKQGCTVFTIQHKITEGDPYMVLTTSQREFRHYRDRSGSKTTVRALEECSSTPLAIDDDGGNREHMGYILEKLGYVLSRS